MENNWIQYNKHPVANIINKCTELSYKSQPKDDILYEVIIRVLKGAILEIEKLQKEVDELVKNKAILETEKLQK